MAPGSPLKGLFQKRSQQDSFSASESLYARTDSTSKRGWFGGLTGKRGSISSAAAAEEIARQDPEYFRTQFYKQELDIRNLQQEIRARDDDVERMQQQWNLQNFKYQLLIDMWAMRVLDNEQLASNA